MARQYIIGHIPGLKGAPETHVDGVALNGRGGRLGPGDPLPEGTTSFDLTYWYFPTAADIAAGATPGKRINVVIEDVPISASNAEIRAAIMEQRANVRASKTFGYPEAVAYSTV
jgi:hypothetical protein